MAILSNWHTRQLDFVLAFTQADIERDLYMKLPAGFTVPGRTITEQDRRDYVLKLEKNLYGQKQAGRVWYLHQRNNTCTYVDSTHPIIQLIITTSIISKPTPPSR